MGSMKSLMLGAAVLVGALGMGATTAQASEFRIYIGGHSNYVPPCPGPGYVWMNGYQADGYWIPGRWNFVGFRDRARFEHFDRDRNFDRDRSRNDDRRFDRDYDRGRDSNRDRDRDHDRDRFRK